MIVLTDSIPNGQWDFNVDPRDPNEGQARSTTKARTSSGPTAT